MNTSRRNFFGIGAAIAAAAAVPEIAEAKPAEEAVGPIMYEHTCDAGKSRYTPQEVAEVESHGRSYWGCGTRFRWYFGVPIYCPKCGWAYESTLEALKTYKRVQ